MHDLKLIEELENNNFVQDKTHKTVYNTCNLQVNIKKQAQCWQCLEEILNENGNDNSTISEG